MIIRDQMATARANIEAVVRGSLPATAVVGGGLGKTHLVEDVPVDG